MRRSGLRFKAWWLMVAVAVVAVTCAAARINNELRAAVAIVGGCVVFLACQRYSEAVARRQAQGLITNRSKKVGLLLTSTIIAAAIIGLSDIAFLAGYSGYLKIASEIFIRSHWTPYNDASHMGTGGIIGLILALCVASSLRQTVWPHERTAAMPARRYRQLWPVAVTALILLALGLEAMRQRWRYCRMMAEFHGSARAEWEVPDKAASHAWLKRWYERAALRPWLPVHPDHMPPGL